MAIFDGVSEKGLYTGADMKTVLSGECAEYTDSKLEVLDALLRGEPPTDEQLDASGVYPMDSITWFDGAVNYLAVYTFRDKERALLMCRKMETEMGIRTETVAAFRQKVTRHEWESGRPMRLGMSGEGLYVSAQKYSWWMENPTDAERARAGLDKHRSTLTDGFYFMIPAAATLVGDGCLDTITVEAYVIREGDGDRNSREAHEAILALGLCGGLVFDPESLSLSQRVGSSFTDERQERGGVYGSRPAFLFGETILRDMIVSFVSP